MYCSHIRILRRSGWPSKRMPNMSKHSRSIQSAPLYTGTSEAHVVLPAGSLVFFSPHLVHGSEPNRSDWRRIGYSIHYCSTEVRMVQYADAEKPGAVLLRGEDTFGHWAPEGLCEAEFDRAALDELIAYRQRFLARKRA